MAFMMPVVKNEWDIYKTNRSRRSSECSNPQACRSRKVWRASRQNRLAKCGTSDHPAAVSILMVSECSKSEGPSLSTSPGSDFLTSPAHRSVPLTSRHFSRTSSRASQSSLQSPSKSTGTSPPKTGSSNSLNKFHNRLVDKLKRSLKKAEDCAEDQRNLS
ncbi:PREDICTED: uncharacterized protein LOC106740943 isoform X3 [Dinoponera quadriceps]|uniref:Uncharacterized protein LOC106740943 isoform X3 n=1 Tax=Dinoponera quadriceps TaxID=609295 RepID=A0A6P3WPG1_DINQU|nr:PREDICTED: uncharacterized protein LOC106740943 isoform X3 [Dinoponera quadriceps]